MSLAAVAKRLEFLEETLIYRFLDRVQYAFHPGLYLYPEAEQAELLRSSLLGLRLQLHEAMDSDFGRYRVAEEFPFSRLPAETLAGCTAKNPIAASKPLTVSPCILQKLSSPDFELRPQELRGCEADIPLSLSRIREISQCRGILRAYLDFLAQYCPASKDGHHGSALEHDVMVLQAISRRIHYGAIYIAEIKYREQQASLSPLLHSWRRLSRDLETEPDDDAASEITDLRQRILALITRPAVEQRILRRVYDKARAIQLAARSAQNIPEATGAGDSQRYYLRPEALRDFYADCVIPLTKQGELAYLYRRV